MPEDKAPTVPTRKVYYLYTAQGAGPLEVRNVAAFAETYGLDLKGVWNMLRGFTRHYQGWHLDEQRTSAHLRRVREVEDLLRSGSVVLEPTDTLLLLLGGHQ